MEVTIGALDERTKSHEKRLDVHDDVLKEHDDKIAGLRADARVGALIGGLIAGVFCSIAGGVVVWVITAALAHAHHG